MFGSHWRRRFGDVFGDAEKEAWQGWGQRGRGRFERGDMRYLILSLLRERPMHGYEVIRELERRFGGMYTPSPGTVYPTLQMLEDMGHVSSVQEDGKKVYTITEAGRAFLQERRERAEGVWGRMGEWWQGGPEREELRLLFQELRALAGTLRPLVHGMTPDQIRRLRELLARTRREVADIMRTSVQ